MTGTTDGFECRSKALIGNGNKSEPEGVEARINIVLMRTQADVFT